MSHLSKEIRRGFSATCGQGFELRTLHFRRTGYLVNPESPSASAGRAPHLNTNPDGAPAQKIALLSGPAFLFLLGGAVVWGSSMLGFWVSLGPGPGFFPLILGILLLGLSAVWALELLRSERHLEKASDQAEDGNTPSLDFPGHAEEPDVPLKRVAVIVGSLILLALGMETLGFQLSMLVFLIFHLGTLGRRHWFLTAIVSVAGSFGVFTLFTVLLSVSLPAASVPFLRALGF